MGHITFVPDRCESAPKVERISDPYCDMSHCSAGHLWLKFGPKHSVLVVVPPLHAPPQGTTVLQGQFLCSQPPHTMTRLASVEDIKSLKVAEILICSSLVELCRPFFT